MEMENNRIDRKFWVVNEGELEFIDLEKRWQDTEGDHNGEIAYQYFEMFHCPFHTDTNCDYERQGCLIQPGDTVIDVGGNMGIFARRAWERGAKKIVSFEPQRLTYQCHLKNLKPEMEPYNMAISDTVGTTKILFGGSRKTGGGSIITGYDSQGNEEFLSENVLTMTLDKLFEIGLLESVDFLKIDVEGAETLVLKGISDQNLKKFRCVSMEVHRNVVNDEAREGIVKRLTDLGFKHFAMFYGGALVTYNFWQ